MRIKKSKLLLISFLAAAISLFILVSIVRGEKIILQWDAVEGVDGYHLYQTIRARNPDTGQVEHQFDYSAPAATLPQATTEHTVDLPGVAGEDTKYVFTARSYRGEDTSVDSNVVAYVVSLVPPPAPGGLSGYYDVDAGAVTLSWEQPAEDEAWRSISHWILFYRSGGGEEFQQLGRVNADQQLELSAQFDAVPEGIRAEVEFVVVAYRSSGVYSANSAPFRIEIDRSGGVVPPIDELRISVIIPVE
jgi:hypothetical protein